MTLNEVDEYIRDVLDVLTNWVGEPIESPQARIDRAVELLNKILPLGDDE